MSFMHGRKDRERLGMQVGESHGGLSLGLLGPDLGNGPKNVRPK